MNFLCSSPIKKSGMTKKRAEVAPVALLLILLVAILVIFGILPIILSYLKTYPIIEGCRASIVIASATKTIGNTFMDVHCERREVTIAKSDGYRGSTYDPEKLKQKLAS